MNIFDEMSNGPYNGTYKELTRQELPIETRYMLAKQIPSINDYEMVIETKYGYAIIEEPELIAKIKSTIEKFYSDRL